LKWPPGIAELTKQRDIYRKKISDRKKKQTQALDEQRRLLIGRVIFIAMKNDQLLKQQVMDLLDKGLTKQKDRDYFDLAVASSDSLAS
jgi:hypothetical protein